MQTLNVVDTCRLKCISPLAVSLISLSSSQFQVNFFCTQSIAAMSMGSLVGILRTVEKLSYHA